MKHFTISELCKSTTADAFNINNQPTPDIVDNLEILINECRDKIRENFGKPIYVNSGYRCKELNDRVKGSKTSHHLYGKAADITLKSKKLNKVLFNLIQDMIKSGTLKCTQLIDEYSYQWIHISYDKDNLKCQILQLK